MGINILGYREDEEKILEKIILVDGKKAVLSKRKSIDRDFDFPPCLENKININLTLSSKLGYTVDCDLSLPEIFSIVGEKIPEHRLKEKLCSILIIPYYFEKKGGKRETKKVKATAENETLYFHSLSSAGKFFQLDPGTISKIIRKKYRLPFWFKRYSLEFA